MQLPQESRNLAEDIQVAERIFEVNTEASLWKLLQSTMGLKPSLFRTPPPQFPVIWILI